MTHTTRDAATDTGPRMWKVTVKTNDSVDVYTVEACGQSPALHKVGAEHPEIYDEFNVKVWVEKAE